MKRAMASPCAKVIDVRRPQRSTQNNSQFSLKTQDSPYRDALSEGVLRLQESGKLALLKTKWWNEKKGGGACQVNISMSYVLKQFYLNRLPM